jgi:hypothetical protein
VNKWKLNEELYECNTCSGQNACTQWVAYGSIGASERTWVLTGFDRSQLSQQPMTTGWIWSGCRLLNFYKKTNLLRFRLCPNGVKNRTRPDLKPLSMCGGTGYVVGVGAEWVGGHLDARWKTAFARWLRSRHRAVSNQPLKSVSLGLSMLDSAILSWVVGFTPRQTLSTIAMGLV